MTGRGPDLVIRNGTVLDGTGAEPFRGDVAVEDGRIARIGEIEPGPNELDAAGRYVAPGFIDIHSHSDYTLLVDPRAVSAIHQGWADVPPPTFPNYEAGTWGPEAVNALLAKDGREWRRP